MTVSVVIPVYNVKPYLERCLKSVLRQTYKDMEVILVDDGSKDGSGELCDELATTDAQRIRVIHQQNQGLSGARNTGIRHATGEYIIFLDSDDEWLLADGLEKLVQASVGRDLVVFRCVDIWADGRQVNRQAYNIEDIDKLSNAQDVFAYLVQMQQLHIAAWAVMVRRSILIDHEIYFPSGLISEDLFWSLHLWQYVQTVKVLNLYFLGYYHRGGSITTSPSIRAYDSFDKIFTYWKEQCNLGCVNAISIRSYLADMWVNRGYAYYMLKAVDKPAALNILQRHVDLLQFADTTKSKRVKILVDVIGIRNAVMLLGFYWHLRTWMKAHVV